MRGRLLATSSRTAPIPAAPEPPSRSLPVRMVYDLPTFCREFCIGRTRAYQEIAAGRLRATKIGARTVVVGSDAMEWLDARRNETATAAA